MARLTGVPEATLRVWERRYGAVLPERTVKGGRLYSDADIERICLLKRAVEAGFPIGTIYDISSEDLEKRLRRTLPRNAGGDVLPELAVVLIGPTLSARCPSAVLAGPARVVARFASLEQFDGGAPGCDAVLIEEASLLPETVRRLVALRGRTTASRLIVIYRFASPAALEQLERAGLCAVRGPLEPEQLERLCLQQCRQPSAADNDAILAPSPPQRRYTDTQLARLLGRQTSVECQCPRHLADLLTALNAFEAYSAGCENRDDADATLHAMLAKAAGGARCIMEQGLERVLLHEGLTL
ncbi:MAG: MerR family transcriptional regulator [Gammaproteobacteria bacterium]|nr:MerR family transcriptional regulator [Gammaproteobacteria bacterium]